MSDFEHSDNDNDNDNDDEYEQNDDLGNPIHSHSQNRHDVPQYDISDSQYVSYAHRQKKNLFSS